MINRIQIIDVCRAYIVIEMYHIDSRTWRFSIEFNNHVNHGDIYFNLKGEYEVTLSWESMPMMLILLRAYLNMHSTKTEIELDDIFAALETRFTEWGKM